MGPTPIRWAHFRAPCTENKYYRPQQRCIMLSGDAFCAVCRHAIEEIIDLYSRP